MKRGYSIGIDVHCSFCEVAAVSDGGRSIRQFRCATTIAALAAVLGEIPGPRHVVIEEGPLAGWLWRSLQDRVDSFVVANPRRNRLISDDGDKDDDLDAQKLAQLLRGGYIKPIHQAESRDRSVFKQHVMYYHDRVRQRVAEGLRIGALYRRHGVFVRERDFAAVEDRASLLSRLPENRTLRQEIEHLLQSYDLLGEQQAWSEKRLKELSREHEVIERWTELPGIAWIRSATLFVILDTPWRFRSKSALWRYLGIGLERKRSGKGPEQLRVPERINRLLKATILGAAKSAIAQGENPYADLARRWREQGLSSRLVRRNTGRVLAATLWGMWKNGAAYRPEWVGVSSAAIEAAMASG